MPAVFAPSLRKADADTLLFLTFLLTDMFSSPFSVCEVLQSLHTTTQPDVISSLEPSRLRAGILLIEKFCLVSAPGPIEQALLPTEPCWWFCLQWRFQPL